VVLGCVGLLWAGFTVLGAALGGSNRVREIDHLIGWSMFSLIFTGLGVFTPLTFPFMALGAGLVGFCALMIVLHRDGGFGTPALLRIMVLAIPFLLIASAMKGSQWDDFTAWLLIPRYMLDTQMFPSASNPYPNVVVSGYPYSWHYINYLPSLMIGRLMESAGALSNVFLLLTFAAMLVRLVGIAVDDENLHRRPAWGLCAFAALAVTLINPTFAQKVVLTSYADVASAVTTGMGVIVAWFCIEALVENKTSEARRHAISLGFLLLLLINLKQSTLILALLIVGGFCVVAVRDPRIRIIEALKLIPMILIPPIMIYLIWRYHLVNNTADVRELSLLPFSKWALHVTGDIVARMLLVLSKKGYYLALLLILIGFGFRGFWRSETPFQRLAALAAVVALGYNGFLLFAYIAAFGEEDALRAASYWRYNMHLGLIIVSFAVFGLAKLWHDRYREKIDFSRLKWVALVLIIVAPFVFTKKLRFDRVPMIVHYRAVGEVVARQMTMADRVFIADPTGSGESSAIYTFEMKLRSKHGGFVSAFFADRTIPLKRAINNKAVTAMIIYTTIPEYETILGQKFENGKTHFLKRQPDNSWNIIQTWDQPKT